MIFTQLKLGKKTLDISARNVVVSCSIYQKIHKKYNYRDYCYKTLILLKISHKTEYLTKLHLKLSRKVPISLLLVLLNLVGYAQTLVKIESNSSFEVYELRNDSLFSGAPFEITLTIPQLDSPYQILEQKIVQRTVTKTYSDSELKPVIQFVGGGVVRKQQVSRFKVYQSRVVGNTEYVTQYLKFKVYKTIKKRNARFAEIEDHPLVSGTWLKLELGSQGIYEITPAQLTTAGLAIAGLDPRKIQVWGFDGLMIPEINSESYQSFKQIPIIVTGEDNGVIDDSDRIYLFGNHAYSSNRKSLSNGNYKFSHGMHYYSNSNYLFLTIGNENGKRMSLANSGLTATQTVTEFTDHIFKEEELYKTEQRVRSGRQWLGQVFSSESFASNQTILIDTIPGFKANSNLKVSIRYYAKSTSNSVFTTLLNGGNSGAIQVTRISELNGDTGNSANYRDYDRVLTGISLSNNILKLETQFGNSAQGATGWVDFIDIELQRTLTAERNRLQFFPPTGFNTNQAVKFVLTNFAAKPIAIDATDPYSPKQLSVSEEASNYSLVYFPNPLSRILAQSSFLKPSSIERVENQNISGTVEDINYIIVTDESLLEEAQRLADYRKDNDGLIPLVVTQNQVFNEFSGGTPDIMAIRKLVLHFYNRVSSTELLPKYLLLFGDTTFDYKGIQEGNKIENLVFTYQSMEFVNRTGSFGSDDFFGLLDPNEGAWSSQSELLDIGVGRIPVQSIDEAKTVVDKIISYDSNPDRFGDWKTVFTFAADDDFPDQDRNRDLHVLNADSTAAIIDTENSGIHLKKIYLFDYPVENTAAGRRIPLASRDLINTINNGTLVVNYSGHGAENILADERFFTSEMIPDLVNADKLTIFVTATCSFGRFDDNLDQSGAEKLVLHDKGGAIAALTTTRVVFTSSSANSYNFGLNRVLTQVMSTREPETGLPRRLGDIYQITKITGSVGPSDNSRRFILLGDPATRLALPEKQMIVSSINSNPVPSSGVIGINSLEEVRIGGEVLNGLNTVDANFNGEVFVQVRDARRFVSLPPDRWDCYMPDCGYYLQNDILFNGRATVLNGTFSASFILPKDLGFTGGVGKILLYASEENTDATGAFSRISVTGINGSFQNDGSGPSIELTVNDENFVQGAIVNNTPNLIVKVDDPSGINTAASGIGHELTARLKKVGETEKTFVLNEYFTTDLDNFRKGEARYEFESLDDGDYELSVRAWDIFNNPSEQSVQFTVTNSDDLVIRNVYNYPNPMHSKTKFVIEHNQPGTPMSVLIRVFTLSGKPVYHISEPDYVTNSPFIMIDWDGKDKDGDKLATGTYLYHVRIKVDTPLGKKTKERIEKIVIIN